MHKHINIINDLKHILQFKTFNNYLILKTWINLYLRVIKQNFHKLPIKGMKDLEFGLLKNDTFTHPCYIFILLNISKLCFFFSFYGKNKIILISPK